MASITIRNIEPGLKHRPRLQAARHERSVEEEVRVILRGALPAPRREDGENLFERIRRRFAALGGVELDLPPR